MYLVSACLIGVNCRYNAESTINEHLVRLMEEGQVIPVCPEVLAGLPIPRPPCEIIRDEDGLERVLDKTGADLTDAFLEGAEKTLAICRAAGIHKAILQPRSPSCGHGIIYDGTFTSRRIPGSGMTARLLARNGIEIIPEEEWPSL